MQALWTKVYDLIGKIPVSFVCAVFFFSTLFMALPSGAFVDLRKVDWFWGCPRYTYVVQYSIDGDSRGFVWDYLIFDLLFWVPYFSLLGIVVRMIFRKIGGIKIRPFYSLCIVAGLTGILYIHLYRPDRLVNAVTGGYLSFFESRPKQLDLAIRFGDVEKAQVLLKNYPDLVFRNDITGRTPLQEAAYWGQSSIARLLLTDGANVNAKDSLADTPLFDAALNGYMGTTELLIKNGAEVNFKNHYGETPLLEAAQYGNTRIVELLLASKADVNAKDRDGVTPLHVALSNGYTNIVKFLRQHGATDN